MFKMFGQTGPSYFTNRHFVNCKRIPDSTWAWIGFYFCHSLQCWPKNQRNVAIRRVLWASNAAKCNCSRGSTPDLLSTSLPQIQQQVLRGRKGGMEERERKEEEVVTNVQLQQGCWLAKARHDTGNEHNWYLTLTLIQPVSNWTHWATLQHHACLSRAATSASSQANPIFCRSLLTTPLEFTLGRPGPLLYPGTCQYSACCGMRW